MVGGILLAGSTLLHALSIPFTLLVLKIAFERQSRANVTWDFFFSVLEARGTLTVLLQGAAVQAGLATVVAIGAVLTYQKQGREGIAIAVACVGAFGIAFSFLVFGGIFGILAGILSLGGSARRLLSPLLPTTEPVATPPSHTPGVPPSAREDRLAGILLVGACCLHVLSVPVGMFALKALVERVAGRAVSWSELFTAAAATDALALLVVGVLIQFAFAFIALLGTLKFSHRLRSAGVPMIAAGAAAIPLSVLVFGGVLGAMGGVLSMIGGLRERTLDWSR